jgi:hypothetical protein
MSAIMMTMRFDVSTMGMGMQVVQGDDATRVDVNEMSNIFPVATDIVASIL